MMSKFSMFGNGERLAAVSIHLMFGAIFLSIAIFFVVGLSVLSHSALIDACREKPEIYICPIVGADDE